jgi:hypothetical protein
VPGWAVALIVLSSCALGTALMVIAGFVVNCASQLSDGERAVCLVYSVDGLGLGSPVHVQTRPAAAWLPACSPAAPPGLLAPRRRLAPRQRCVHARAPCLTRPTPPVSPPPSLPHVQATRTTRRSAGRCCCA